MRTGRGGSSTLGRVCGGGLLEKVTLEAGQSEIKAQGTSGNQRCRQRAQRAGRPEQEHCLPSNLLSTTWSRLFSP